MSQSAPFKPLWHPPKFCFPGKRSERQLCLTLAIGMYFGNKLVERGHRVIARGGRHLAPTLRSGCQHRSRQCAMVLKRRGKLWRFA